MPGGPGPWGMTIGCPDCGALEDLPPLRPPFQAICRTCRAPLERTLGRSPDAALACALATLVLLLPANLAPLMTVGIMGAERTTVLGSGVAAFWEGGWPILACLVAAFAVAARWCASGCSPSCWPACSLVRAHGDSAASTAGRCGSITGR